MKMTSGHNAFWVTSAPELTSIPRHQLTNFTSQPRRNNGVDNGTVSSVHVNVASLTLYLIGRGSFNHQNAMQKFSEVRSALKSSRNLSEAVCVSQISHIKHLTSLGHIKGRADTQIYGHLGLACKYFAPCYISTVVWCPFRGKNFSHLLCSKDKIRWLSCM